MSQDLNWNGLMPKRMALAIFLCYLSEWCAIRRTPNITFSVNMERIIATFRQARLEHQPHKGSTGKRFFISFEISGIKFPFCKQHGLLVLQTCLSLGLTFSLFEARILPEIVSPTWTPRNGCLASAEWTIAFLEGQICWNDFRVNQKAVSLCITPS